MLKVSQDKNHSILSRRTNDREFLKNLEARTPIAWPKIDDETSWSKLDGAVYCRFHNCCSLSDRVQLLSDTKTKNLSGHSRRTKYSIELIQQKTLLSSQISATCIPEEQAGLTLLLSQVKGKIKSLRRSERSRKKRWKVKQTRSAFRNDPYKAGKDLLNPKCTSTLHVDQASLDNHKATIMEKN